MIQKDIDALTREKSNNIKKHNILNILNNVGAVFGSIYFHHKDVPKETMFERTIVERSKLRRGKIIEIEREEKYINNELVKECFTNYQSPSDMYKKIRRDRRYKIWESSIFKQRGVKWNEKSHWKCAWK